MFLDILALKKMKLDNLRNFNTVNPVNLKELAGDAYLFKTKVYSLKHDNFSGAIISKSMVLATPIVNLFTMANDGVMSMKTLHAGTRPYHPKIRLFKKIHMQEEQLYLERFTGQKQHAKMQITIHPLICQHFYLDTNLMKKNLTVEKM